MLRFEGLETYRVSRADREPLLRFLIEGLKGNGCGVLRASGASQAPFLLSIETPWGDRVGIVAYAFLANQRTTKNRPPDEHRFQIKYGSKNDRLLRLWQDPFGLFTTVLVGINPDRDYLIGADPMLNDPTPLFISKEFKEAHVAAVAKKGWAHWERKHRAANEGSEVLVGVNRKNLLRYVLFERDYQRDSGDRRALATRYGSPNWRR